MGKYEATIYVVGPDDRIIKVNEGFWAFAACNDWKAVIGRPLWDFIKPEGLAALYQTLIATVRETNKAFCFPFRCDSPFLRRLMTMAVAPEHNGTVRFVVELDKEVPLHKADGTDESKSTRFICRRCRKISHHGDWLPLEYALTAQLIDVGADAILLGTCDACRTQDPAMNPSHAVLH